MATVDESAGTTYAAGYGSVPTAEPPSYATARDAETGAAVLQDEYKETLVNVSLAVRMSFVRKVYSILAAQLGLTALVSAFCLYNTTVREFVQSHPAILMVTAFGTIGLIFAVEIYRRSYPLNMILLGIFTLAESYTIGFVCSLYESEIVLQAALLTFVVFIGLTLFTLQSKADFSGMGPFLFASLLTLVFAGLLQIFFPFSKLMDTVFAVIAALIFCGYILYDTYNLFERLSPEEYIDASIQLYLDIVNLFLYILRILGNSRD